MSKGQTLRALVNERLTAAAQEIFALFERTIAEYEEELCRSKEENQRKQELLDSVLSPRLQLQDEGEHCRRCKYSRDTALCLVVVHFFNDCALD